MKVEKEREECIEVVVHKDPCYGCGQKYTHHCNDCYDLDEFDRLPVRTNVVEMIAKFHCEYIVCKNWNLATKAERADRIAVAKTLLHLLIEKCKN